MVNYPKKSIYVQFSSYSYALLICQCVYEYLNKHFNLLCKSHKHVGVVGIRHKIYMEVT